MFELIQNLLDDLEEWQNESPLRGIILAVFVNVLFWGAIILFS